MRAASIRRWGAPPEVGEAPVPPVGPQELLVRVRAAIVSHLDLTIASGNFAVVPPLPHIGGVEAAGEVVAYGDGVDERDWVSGDEPAIVQVCGGGVGVLRPGGWAEYVAVPVQASFPVPAGVDPATALGVAQPTVTAWQALLGAGAWRAGERVAITGANGACGAAAVRLALATGHGPVFANVRTAALAAALPDGATPLIDDDGSTAPDEPIDLLVDNVGGPALARRLSWVRPGGRVVLVGYTAGTRVTLDLPNLLAADVALIPLNGLRFGARGPREARGGREARAQAFALAAAGELRPELDEVPLQDMPEAFARLAQGHYRGRLVAVP